MLFMPFIENSYKHGISDNIEETKIIIALTQKENYCQLSIENNYDISKKNDKNNYSGVGIDNVKKNLNIVYPNAHELNISDAEAIFKVDLKIFDNEY